MSCQPVGEVDIARRLGVRQQTVAMWRLRSRKGEMPDPMPGPEWTVSGLPCWNWPTMEEWARRTKRLPGKEASP